MKLEQAIATVRPLDGQAMERAQARWDAMAKPLNGLGELERILVRIAGIQRSERIAIDRKTVAVFCADNGVVAEGVSQSGQEVTAIIARSLAAGTSTICCMAEQASAQVLPVDIGVAEDVEEETLLHRKIARGTNNIAQQPAMTREQAVRAVEVGIETALLCKEQGCQLLAAGEMGIGNTTTAAAVTCALLGVEAAAVTGRGAGLSDAALAKKIAVVEGAVRLHQPNSADPLDVLHKVGGYDLCGMAGLMLGGAATGLPTVLDGAISCASALCAVRLCPAVRDYLIPSHRSREPMGQLLLAELDLRPVIDADMALGEGTGAVCLFPLLDMAQHLYRRLHTFGDLDMDAYVPQSEC